jgi:hypothetical protein
LGASATSSTSSLNITDNTSASLLFVRDDGFVGISTITQIGGEKLNVNGSIFPATSGFDLGYNHATSTWNNVYGVNAYTSTSDIRSKTNIKPLSYGLNEIMKLQTHFYEWKNNPNGRRIGFISQEILEVIPEAVVIPQNDSEAYMMRYTEIIPVLVNGIQEQQRMIEIQQNQISKLQEQINMLTENGNNLQKQKNDSTELNQVITLIGSPQLLQNNPNPFSASAIIRYYLPINISNAVLKITDSNGKELVSYRLVNTGYSHINIEAGGIATGAYNYTLIVDDKIIDTKKMIIAQ